MVPITAEVRVLDNSKYRRLDHITKEIRVEVSYFPHLIFLERNIFCETDLSKLHLIERYYPFNRPIKVGNLSIEFATLITIIDLDNTLLQLNEKMMP